MTNKNYRCYFTDSDDRIQSREQIECPDDGAAAIKVHELLASSQFAAAELWQGKRLVGRWTAGSHDHTEEIPNATRVFGNSAARTQ
jgi:hypothetical protein